MSGRELRVGREQRGWTQAHTAELLGVSQPYLALLEAGRRKVPPRLAHRAARVLNLAPTSLPLPLQAPLFAVHADHLARQFAALGYPGFAYLRAGWKRNPAEVLVSALAQPNLEPRLTEALPWVLLRFAAQLDRNWLVQHARLYKLSNRLGYVVHLAKRVLETRGNLDCAAYVALAALENELKASRLAAEDTLCQSALSPAEREWLRQARPAEARYWNLLTDWRPEHLQYAKE
jgi:transcriptional regulator with XRE-family HTH domain